MFGGFHEKDIGKKGLEVSRLDCVRGEMILTFLVVTEYSFPFLRNDFSHERWVRVLARLDCGFPSFHR
jgi:hypothetical protein